MMRKAGVVVKISSKALAEVLESEISKSSKMKQLFDMGYEVKEISTLMMVRYNFVYNVVSNYVNMNGIVVESQKKEGKKDAIIEMYLAGKSNKEISIELKTNYNYVFNVLKTYKADHPAQVVVDDKKAE
jgi:DNA-binding protein